MTRRYISYDVKNTNHGTYMVVYREGMVDSYVKGFDELEDAISYARDMNRGKEPEVRLS